MYVGGELMKFQVSDGEKFQKIMEIEIPVEELDQPIRFACKRLSQKVNIPGFRKGKVPRAILENYLGINAILEEAADELLPKAYAQGLVETGLEPVCQPEIEVVTMEDGQPMRFNATITVKPEVKLGEYKGLEINRRIIDIEEEDIDNEIESQRQRMSKTVDAPEGAEAANGDTVVIDFKGIKDGVAFEGGTAQDYPLTLGSGSFIPGFEEQLIGAKVGDEKKIDVTFPEEYHAKELAGQPVVFEVTVKGIKNNVLPELNQEFVEEVSETAENIDQLRAEFRAKMEEQSLKAADDNARNDALAKAVEGMEVELPPVMVEQQMEGMIDDAKRQITSQGMSFEQYLEYVKRSEEDFREQYRKQAEFIVKRELLLEAIVKAENLEASEEDIDAQINEIAARYWMPADQVKKVLSDGNRMEDVKYDAVMKKAVDVIFDNAKITNIHINRAELAKQATEAMQAEEAADAEKKEAKPKSKAKAKTKTEAKDEDKAETAKPKTRAKAAAKDGEEKPKTTRTRAKKTEDGAEAEAKAAKPKTTRSKAKAEPKADAVEDSAKDAE